MAKLPPKTPFKGSSAKGSSTKGSSFKGPAKGAPGKGAPAKAGPRHPGSQGSRPKQGGPQRPYFKAPGERQAREARPEGKAESGLWLYGLHAVRAAIANPRRRVKRAVLTARAAEEIGEELLGRVRYEIVEIDAVHRLLPQTAVHQGVALLCEHLPGITLADALKPSERRRVVLVLDQISDPHNEGAILRTAAAFGVSAVVVQDRNSAAESGALAKAASGALDIIPVVSVVNISRALEELQKLGFWRVALAGDGEGPLKDAVKDEGDIALVLGSEGSGIRRLVRENCDVGAYVPIDSAMESLNVSNAAAIALYELRR